MASRLILSGLRSIEECLNTNPERISKLLVPSGRLSPRLAQLRDLAQARGIHIETNPRTDAEDPVLAVLHDYQYANFDALLDELKESLSQEQHPVVLALDGITDPQNLGAILRTAAFMGVAGVILPKDRSAVITDTVYRIASGGLEHVRVSQVTNLVSALQTLKDIGFWSVGFSEHATQQLSELKRDFAPVLVIGNEEKGIRPLVQQNCDFMVKLTGKGGLQSLNASAAASLAMAWASCLL